MTDAPHHPVAQPGDRSLAATMAAAAEELLASCTARQRDQISWPDADDDERYRWFYTPTDHGGLPLSAMTAPQQRLTHRLLASGLSEAGYVTAAAIMGLENVLDRVEGWRVDFERARGRDPQLYWIALFGRPGASVWGWRFGGHHVSANYLVVEGRVVGHTPSFFGADPASAPLLGPHPHRPLAGVEDLGRELVRSLDEQQKASAVVSAVAPSDLVGGNRTSLNEGDTPLPLHLVWRGRFERALDQALAETQREMDRSLGFESEHREAVAFSRAPRGLRAERLTGDQIEILRALVDCYLLRLPDEVATIEQRKLDGDAVNALSFLWAGGTDAQDPHYYRIQGTELLVEYDNTQRDVNHVHSVWRDLRNDFGGDALARHYAGGTHHH